MASNEAIDAAMHAWGAAVTETEGMPDRDAAMRLCWSAAIDAAARAETMANDAVIDAAMVAWGFWDAPAPKTAPAPEAWPPRSA
jgi:hypothetical protein